MRVVYNIGKAVRAKQAREAAEFAAAKKAEPPQETIEQKLQKYGFAKRVWSYTKALARWNLAGQPLRSEAEQQRVLDICKGCPLFEPNKKPNRPGNCGICGCKLNIKNGKIAWATESCPLVPPKWTATVSTPESQETAIVEVQEATQQIKPSRSERHAARDARIAARKARHEAQERSKALAEASRALPDGPPANATQASKADISVPPPQKGETGRQKRIRERSERMERRRLSKLAMGGETPPLIEQKPTDDPLLMYDRNGQPIGHCLRDLWNGSAAFYVCGGPSLKEIDLSFLRERGIVSMGINNVGGYAPVRAWTFSDPAEKFHHGIFLDPAIMKFVPRPKLSNRVRAKMPDGRFQWTRYDVKQCPNIFSYDRETHFYPEQFFTTTWATWGPSKKHDENKDKPTVLFTFFLGLRLLHYLGVRRVYLLGADFKMDATHHYAFGQDRHPGAEASNNNSYRVASILLAQLRPVFDAAKFEVFQTNKKSGLKVFDYVPLETAIDDCRGVVPKEPWPQDAYSGWYEKIDPHGQPTKDATDDRGE